MPRLLHDLQSLLKRLREVLFKSLFRARFKYDVFISYSHRDSKEYAVNLKNQLSKLDFSCFIDEEEAPVGSSLDPTLTKALSKTAVLVFLATEWAITRPYIVSEFENFVATGRTIVPINILGTLTNNNEATLTRSPWNAIKDRKLVWLDETDEAFAKKNPSPSIADGIDKLFKYTRRNVRVRVEIIGTAVLVLLAAIGAGFVIKDKADEVKRQTNVADAARQEATKQQGIADEAGKEAQRQLTAAKNATEQANQQRQLAETAKHDAETAKEEANRQQEIARAAKDEANKQQQLARIAKAEADRQQTIAHARQLANQAELDRGISSDDLLNSTSTAKRSIELHHTLEGDLALRKSLNLLPLRSDEITYRGKLTAGAASPNATAVAFLDANGEVQIHRRDKNVVSKNRPAAHTLLALSNDGQYFATAGGHTALIQNTDTDQSWDITIFEESNIKAIALSPKGNYLAMIASEDEGLWVEVWERDSRKLIGKPIHGSIDFMQLASLAFSADENNLLVVGGNEKKGGAVNGFLRTWVIEEPAPKDSSQQGEKNSSYSFESRSTLRQPLSVNMVAAASKDDYLVTAGDYTAVVWKRTRLGDYEQIARIPLEHSLALAFDPGPRHLHVISQPTGWIDGAPRDVDKTVKIWDTSGQRQNAGTALDEEILGVSFSRNRDLITTITQAIATEENAFRLWDPLKLDERKQDRIKLSGPRHFAFSGDGNYLAAEDEQGVVQLWNVIDNVAYGSIASNSLLSAIESIEVSWYGQFLALAGTGKDDQPTVVVYERQDGSYQQLSHTIRLPSGTPLEALGLSPDGRLIATATRDYQVKIWDVRKARDVTPMLLRHGSQVRAILFSSNGERIVAVGYSGNTIVWTTSTGKTVASIGGTSTAFSHGSHNVAMSEDGRQIALGIFDGSARIFDVSTGEELIRLQHDDPVVAVSFSRDGKYLASATSADSDTAGRQAYRLWTWLIQPKDVIAEACKRSQRACQ